VFINIDATREVRTESCNTDKTTDVYQTNHKMAAPTVITPAIFTYTSTPSADWAKSGTADKM